MFYYYIIICAPNNIYTILIQSFEFLQQNPLIIQPHFDLHEICFQFENDRRFDSL